MPTTKSEQLCFLKCPFSTKSRGKPSCLVASMVRPLLLRHTGGELKNQESLIMGHRPTFSLSLSSSRELFASPEILQPSIPALALSSIALHVCPFQCNFSWVCDSELMQFAVSWRELTCPRDTVNEQQQFLWVQNSYKDLYQLSQWLVNHHKPSEWRITYLTSAVSYLSDENAREQLCDISSFTSHKANQS